MRRSPLGDALIALIPLLATTAGAQSSVLLETPLELPSLAQGAQVAVLATRTPQVPEFVLHGCIPVPAGTWLPGSGARPLTVLDYDGTPLATQIEPVSLYADPAAGADVVEVIARVRRDPAAPLDALQRHPVIWSTPPEHSGEHPVIPSNVRALVLDPGAIEIAAYDVFGNRYSCRPLDGTGTVARKRTGTVHPEQRVYQELLPDSPRTGALATLPHLLGVHSYLSVFQGAEHIGLDLRFHNGHDGNDPDTPIDDPLDKVYFRRIEISLPLGWNLLQDTDDPFFGAVRTEGGRKIYDLVGQDPAVRPHVIRWQGQFNRRLSIAAAHPEALAEARAALNQAGRAFCSRGSAPDGRELWSWWNWGTARYFPQKKQLPLLDHIDGAALEAQLNGERDFLAGMLESGQGNGTYPVVAGVLGWGHPYGVSYGGMTSGLEIVAWDGLETAWAASRNGYRAYQLLHRMATDRMPNALYSRDGEPSSVERWLVENGSADYVPMDHYVVPLLFGSHPDPFGFHDAPRFQIDFVAAHGLQPAYEALHLAYDPHDYQHFVRYTRAAKVLAWLGNDSLAKDDLRMQAENFHLSYHPYRNGPFGGSSSSGMLSARRYVNEHPGKGFPFGRGEAWGIDCVAAAYGLAGPEWRERKRPWLSAIVDLLLDGQAQCSGFIQAFVSDKAVGGRYQARQLIEQTLTETMLVSLHESVFRGLDAVRAQMVRDIAARSLNAFIGEMSWFPGQGGPWRYTAVAPLNPDLPVFCSRADLPPDGWTEGDIDTYQDWPSFAHGYQLTGDPAFLRQARVQLGALDYVETLHQLEVSGTDNLGNRAPLLALLQRLAGEL
jgi:hypothetical protein